MGNVTAKTSGDIASFMTPAETNIKSLKVYFSPKQLGEGNPSPDNVREIVGWDGVKVNGCGKNLASVQYGYDSYGGDPTSTVIQYRSNNINEYVSSLINVKPNTTYTISRESVGGIFRYYFYSEYPILDTTYSIDGSSGNANKYSFTFTTPSNAKYLFVVWTRTNSTRPCGKVQIELGSSPTSYESYQGTTIPVDFTNNYLNKVQITNNKTINSTGEEITESSMSVTDYIPVNENEKWFLYFVSTTAGRTRRIWGYDENKQPISEFAKVSWATVDQEYTLIANITNDVKYIRACYYTNDTDLLLTIDGTSFKNVYGGYVDLISGELVQDMAYGQVTSEWLSSRESGYIGYTSSITALDGSSGVWVRNAFNSTARERKSGGIKANCNAFKVLMNSTGVSSSQNRTAFVVDSETITSVADFISTVETLEQNDNGLYLAYELATPITHQLTPTQLSSFIGQNNFWSNADYVEIEYELKETEDIQKARKKIILNQPHIESVKDDLVNFNTDLRAPLKECKVYFEPIQEGEGDPSPDNVRNITGWDGISVGLPSEYQEVEYIESTGTQFIQLPFGFDRTDEVEARFVLTKVSDDMRDKYIVSPQVWNNDSNRYAMGVHFANKTYNTWTVAFGASRTGSTWLAPVPLATYDFEMHTWTYKDNVFSVEEVGRSRDVSSINFGTTSQPLKLFYGYDSNTAGKIAYYKHKKTNGDLYNLIPCYRKSDNEIGMYDTVSKTFYTNSGTGTFLKGDDVNTIIGNINWSDEVGTVYGGYVDLVKGELVATHVAVDLGDLEIRVVSADNNTYRAVLEIPCKTGVNGAETDLYCTALTSIKDHAVAIGGIYNMEFNHIAIRAEHPESLYIKSNAESASALKESLLGVIAVYQVEVPIHYQLTPQQLLTLKGTNNIWSNTNSQIEVKFWTH